jgi:glycosyltransferase involved in cell wall biosynthesis
MDRDQALRVLLVTPFFTPQTGGVTTYIEDLRRILSARGHEVYVLRDGESESIRQCPRNSDARVFEFSMRPFWCPEAPIKGALAFIVYFLPTIWVLTRFVRQHRFQILCLEYPLGYMSYFSILRLWTRVKLIAGLHGDDVRSLSLRPRCEQWLVKSIVRSADCVLTHSRSMLRDAEHVIGQLRRRQDCIPYGVDSEQMLRHASESRAVFPGKYILTVAKLYSRKGLDVLLASIVQLKHLHQDYKFVIAGDGPEEDTLRQRAAELGLGDVVVFTGYVKSDAIPTLVRDCDFFVLPSRSEPFGIVLLEAMAFGKAVVATRVGGIPEFVTDGVNGILVPSEDSKALAQAITLVAGNEELRNNLGRRGRAAIDDTFNFTSLGARYEQLLSSVLTEARTS